MKIGDVDVLNSMLDYELRIGVLERVFDFLIQKNPTLQKPTREQIEQWRDDVISKMQTKYPNMGIKYQRN